MGQPGLGADGATITLERGILKASRGLGDDLMGSTSYMPTWSKINKKAKTYNRELNHITGNNKIFKQVFICDIEKTSSQELIKIWDVNFKVAKYEERCFNSNFTFKNVYHIDKQEIIRRSSQFHSKTLGYIKMERIDR